MYLVLLNRLTCQTMLLFYIGLLGSYSFFLMCHWQRFWVCSPNSINPISPVFFFNPHLRICFLTFNRGRKRQAGRQAGRQTDRQTSIGCLPYGPRLGMEPTPFSMRDDAPTSQRPTQPCGTCCTAAGGSGNLGTHRQYHRTDCRCARAHTCVPKL